MEPSVCGPSSAPGSTTYRTRGDRSTVDLESDPNQRELADSDCARPCDSRLCARRPRSVVRLATCSLGPAGPCLVARSLRAFFGRLCLSRSDGARSFERCATTDRAAAQAEDHPGRVRSTRPSGCGAPVVRRPTRAAGRLHARFLVQAVCSTGGRVLYDRSTRTALEPSAAPDSSHKQIERPRSGGSDGLRQCSGMSPERQR